MIFSWFSLKKKKTRFFNVWSWLNICLICVTHAAPKESEGRYLAMADSVSYADCRQQVASQRRCRARADEHVATWKLKDEETQHDERAKIL